MRKTQDQLWAMGALVAASTACSGIGGTVSSDAHDPCRFVAAGEATPYVGALATPPYRASDGVADAHGDQCMYRGQDGRQFTVAPDWTSGGADATRMAADIPNALGKALDPAGSNGLGGVAHKVMKTDIAGPWDKATWIPGGSIFAVKGDYSISVDVTGASGQEQDAVAIATLAMPRFKAPIDYDGAKAVALVPKPRAHPAKACDFISRSAVEGAIGALASAPESDDPATTCTYKVNTPEGERDYTVEFVWQGGQKNFAMLKHSMATVGGMIGAPTSSPLDTMQLPPQMKGMMGGMMKMVGGAASDGKAPGAAATIGFRTDTALAGPWDAAALLHGTQLIAVRHDVFVGMSLASADYEKAKALLTLISAQL